MERRSLLISDLDGTLLGDDSALLEFSNWIESHNGHLSLVYASGRFCHSIAESISETSLPAPIAVIGGVGTEIEYWPTRERIQSWEDYITADWCPVTVRQLLASFPQLELQPEVYQSSRKVSFYYEGADAGFFDQIRLQLEKAAISADIIYSSGRDLDIVPAGANKGTAGAFLAENLEFEKSEVMVAGDSGNDASMFEQRFLGIVPHNAHPELQALEHVRVYHSPFGYAAGVLDGVRYWMNLTR